MARTKKERDYYFAIKKLRAKREALAKELGASWALLSRTIYACPIDYLEPMGEIRLACLPKSLVSILMAINETKEFEDRSASWDRLVDRLIRLRKHAVGARLGRRIAAVRDMKSNRPDRLPGGGAS